MSWSAIFIFLCQIAIPVLAAETCDPRSYEIGRLQAVLLEHSYHPGGGRDAEAVQALLLKDPEQIRKLRGEMEGALGFSAVKQWMYHALAETFQIQGIPLEEKARLAGVLSRCFADFLERFPADASLPPARRRQAEEAAAYLLDPENMILPLARATQLRGRCSALDAKVREMFPSEGAAEETAEAPSAWSVPAAIPKSERGNRADSPRVSFRDNLEIYPDSMKRLDFWLDKLARQDRIAHEKPFSEEMRRWTADSLAAYEGKAKGLIADWDEYLRRFSEVAIGIPFYQLKRHALVNIPSHPALSLTPERFRFGKGFLLKARFKTDIVGHPEVLRAVKASIEDYWSGTFPYRGETYAFRTQVTIEPLGPGESFPKDCLKLIDGKEDRISRANAFSIVLERGFGYDVPAHEFGHVLGLDDEYRESYDPATGDHAFVDAPASLMSSGGQVLPRHLKLAYMGLRRHRLQGARP